MADIEGYNMPDELFYHKDYAWVRVLDDGTVKVGMNDFYQKNSGDTTYIDLPFEGDEVSQGETCGKIQSAKWVGKFVSPLSGEVVSANEALEDDSTLINKDPYGEGWIMILKPSDMDGEKANLMQGDALKAWVKNEIADIERKKQAK